MILLVTLILDVDDQVAGDPTLVENRVCDAAQWMDGVERVLGVEATVLKGAAQDGKPKGERKAAASVHCPGPDGTW